MAHVMVFGTRVSLPSQPGLRCLSVSLARPSTFSLGVADGFQPRRCMYFHPRHRSELGACRRGARAGGGWRVSSHGGSLQGPRGGRRADPPVCSTPTHREGGGEPSGAPSRRPLPVATRRGGGGGRSHAPRTRAVPIYWGGGIPPDGRREPARGRAAALALQGEGSHKQRPPRGRRVNGCVPHSFHAPVGKGDDGGGGVTVPPLCARRGVGGWEGGRQWDHGD